MCGARADPQSRVAHYVRGHPVPNSRGWSFVVRCPKETPMGEIFCAGILRGQ